MSSPRGAGPGSPLIMFFALILKTNSQMCRRFLAGATTRQHFSKGLFWKQEITFGELVPQVRDSVPQSSTLSWDFSKVVNLFAVDSFGMTFHSFEGIGEEAAIRDKFLLIIQFLILIAASSPPLTLTESVIPN
jgi:hypothetical protein